MKKYLLIIIFIMFTGTMSVQAQQKNNISKTEIEYSILKNQYQKILNQQVLLEKERGQMIHDLASEREKYLNFVEKVIGICSVIIIFLGFFATFMGWRTRKDIKSQLEEKKKELTQQMDKLLEKEQEKLTKEAKEKLNCFINDITLNIAKLIQRNPASLKDLIDQKISDYEAKQNNHICLYHTKGDGIDEQLNMYGFNVIEDYDINLVKSPTEIKSFKNASVVFIVDKDLDNRESSFSDHIKNKLDKNVNYFYLGKGRFEGGNLKNYANSKITIEHNLLDLLRYIEYQNNSNIKS
ncbi:MAG: hypothetical protein WCR33_04860 [Bacilli bacterium]